MESTKEASCCLRRCDRTLARWCDDRQQRLLLATALQLAKFLLMEPCTGTRSLMRVSSGAAAINVPS